MPTTHRSELVDKVTNALMDEAYDGGMGPMSEIEFPRHVRRLAETALEAITGAEDAAPADPPRPICPECRDGKHSICIHQALSDDDEFVDCACGCEPSRTCPSCRDVVPVGWTLDDHFNCNFPEDRDV